jgi:hypothetical protein
MFTHNEQEETMDRKCLICKGVGFKEGKICICITGDKSETPDFLKTLFGTPDHVSDIFGIFDKKEDKK